MPPRPAEARRHGRHGRREPKTGSRRTTGYIENKRSKKRTVIEKVKGVYLLKLWVKKEEQQGVNSISSVRGFVNSNSVFARLGQMI